jgi:Zn-dependent metalloprotease
MRNIQHYVCPVIPPHILRHVAQQADGSARESAQETLEVMRMVTADRVRTLRPATPPPQPPPAKRRFVYDAGGKRTLPGRLVMSERRKRGSDVEVNEAFDGSGLTWDFYEEVYGRNSINGRGGPIDSTVHYGRRFDNAFWNGTRMIYGDGDGQIFSRFTIALDVIGHELTHGITQHTAGLGYDGQTGALNEHISDAFGIMVKQRALGLTAEQSDWLIGKGIFTAAVKGKAIRSMSAPGTAYDDPILGRDPQPAHMRDYVKTADDNGGVHINSGILNHGFYLAAVGLGGETWPVLGLVWFVTLTSVKPRLLRPDAGFPDFVDATVAVAGRLYGSGSTPQKVIAEAWAAVGLSPSKATTPAALAA